MRRGRLWAVRKWRVVRKHKKQHFVPVCYLKAWCDPETPPRQEPYVWVFPRDGGEPRNKAPDNILHETDMYTIEVPGKGRNVVLERGLNELETRFTRIRNSKINFGRGLDPHEHVLLCAFVAAAQTRTRASREHHRKQWERPLRMMEDMIETMKHASPEKKRQVASMASPRTAESGGRLTYDDVKALHENPLQQILAPAIAALTPMLCKLDMALMETNDAIGFITSDHPCVWSDPEAYKRAPLYRAPALGYKSIEITFPISPRHCLFLNRRGITGYIEATSTIVDTINRTTRFNCDEEFIVRSNYTNPFWFDPGVEPEDSWEKMQARKATRTNERTS
jgi:hypothetical protein